MGLVVPQVSPFIFSELGIDRPGIIFLLSQIAMPVGTLLTGYISDKTLQVRYPVVFMSILAGISMYGFSLVEYFPDKILFAAIFFSLFMFATGGIMSLINVSYLQNGYEGNRFGRVRLFGTAGFALANAIIMFYRVEPSFSLKLSGIFFIASTLVLYMLPASRDIQFKHQDVVTWLRIKTLSMSGLFSSFIIIMFTFFFGFSTAEYLLSGYIRDFDFPVDPIGFSWLAGTLVEMVFFFISPRILEKFGSVWLIGLSFFAAVIRLGILSYSTDESLILFSQVLHGLQFSGAYLGSLIYLQEKAHPQRLGSAQALYTAYSRAIGTGTGAYVLGNIAGAGDFRNAFEWAFLFSLAGLILLIVFMKVEKKHKYFFDG
jgi:MFS family permease